MNKRLDELVNRDKEELAREVQKMTKRLNERFRQLEKNYKDPSNFSAYQYAQKTLGREKPRYTESVKVLERMPTDSLYEFGLDIARKLASKSSSLVGVKLIEENRITEAIKGIKIGLGIDIKDTDSFRNFMKDYSNDMLSTMSSGELFEIYKMSVDKEIDFKEVNKKYEEYTKNKEVGTDVIGLKRWLKEYDKDEEK